MKQGCRRLDPSTLCTPLRRLFLLHLRCSLYFDAVISVYIGYFRRPLTHPLALVFPLLYPRTCTSTHHPSARTYSYVSPPLPRTLSSLLHLICSHFIISSHLPARLATYSIPILLILYLHTTYYFVPLHHASIHHPLLFQAILPRLVARYGRLSRHHADGPMGSSRVGGGRGERGEEVGSGEGGAGEERRTRFREGWKQDDRGRHALGAFASPTPVAIST
ncbi:hypothetical protein R3P38DRAFT_496669 [Favolaschia claudopus]|uniref:Uncharacterized protein n=1 Tax=Favolaschia claudopus TaxID=2862362 RepID=A0AAW0CJQ0_9AGAR